MERFSVDVDLHDRLFTFLVEVRRVGGLVEDLALRFGVASPEVRPHRGRRINTGACRASRAVLVSHHGEEVVAAAESHRGRPFDERAIIRVGAPTLAGVVAHEFGHHLVHELDGLGVPGHGKRWVRRYDQAAVAVAELLAGALDGTPR